MFFLFPVILFGCTNNKRINVDNIDVSIKVERFDQEMSRLDPDNLGSKIPALEKKYGIFYTDYISGMLNLGDPADSGYFSNLRTVLRNPDYKELNKAVQQKFPTLNKTEVELTQAFKHVRYYYPEQKIPRIISFISGFTVQTPIGNNYLGIGLDMFLGADSKFYPALRQSIPMYIAKKFTPENITPRVIETFAREEMFPEDDNISLLHEMIHNGKILYFMDAVMPDLEDSLKIGYTSEQLEWAKTHEENIWAFFLDQNLLYETDYLKYQKYLNDAPFTPGIGERNESSPKLAVYLGWQIVQKFMDKNPNVTLQQLMEDNDAQKILNRSKYKPQ